VREDYSPGGDAWGYLPHDLARSKAYRWGEDGIAGVCDRYQLLVFAPAFWNTHDPILKERLFGVTPHEGNHGEDVKEYYFHLDCTPTHSYMKYLYKYPHAPFPYGRLIEENRQRGGQGFEFELLDTGIFDENRYFDIFIEYAKEGPEDLCVRIEAFNRGPEAAPLHILPHLWFRNTWAWWKEPQPEPVIRLGSSGPDFVRLVTDDSTAHELANVPVSYRLGPRSLYAAPDGIPLFTNNETNMPRVYGPGNVSRSPYVKDAFHRYLIDGEPCINPGGSGTKAALDYYFPQVPAGGSVVVRLRLSDNANLSAPLANVDRIVAQRRVEADEFYNSLHRPLASSDERHVQRQALAGLLWSKQSYLFDVHRWLEGDNPDWPPPASRRQIRNQHWQHLITMRVMTIPDKWEYPWFAAWDLAFHCAALPWLIPSTPRTSSGYCCSSSSNTPTGRFPPTSGSFPTSTLRFTPGRSGAFTTWTASAPARQTVPSSNAASTSCSSTSPGGSTRWIERETTSSRADSWGWTTSPYSTGARAARMAACWNSRTQRAGWGCSAST
jgi:hypothetical protein